MYLPAHFKQEDVAHLHAAVRERAFATLVTVTTEGPEASHVPMVLDPEPAPYGTLIGHVARANPQWRTARAEVPALAIFTGPDAYVSPAWYPTKEATGKVVPTWNYVAIHATGTLRFFDDADRLLALVTRLTDTHEAGRPTPWAVSDAPADYVQGMLKAIVGFSLTITRLEGKWKMSQNRPAADRVGVVEGLLREGGVIEQKVAKLVRDSTGA